MPLDGTLRSMGGGRVLDNPRSGERIVIRRGADETDGRLLEFDLFLQPGGHVPAGHLHPNQEERFTIRAGSVRFRVGGRTVVAEAGDTLVVPAGKDHWFGNPGPSVAELRVEVRPALRMEELFAASMERSRLPERALILFDFQAEVGVPHVPAKLIAALLTPFAWLRLCFASLPR